jgi:hypothetical protein
MCGIDLVGDDSSLRGALGSKAVGWVVVRGRGMPSSNLCLDGVLDASRSRKFSSKTSGNTLALREYLRDAQ